MIPMIDFLISISNYFQDGRDIVDNFGYGDNFDHVVRQLGSFEFQGLGQ
jgi:hypothetical protein